MNQYAESQGSAFRLLGRTEIPAKIIQLDHIVHGEYAENEIRKDFTVSERVAIAAEVENSYMGRRGRNQYKLKGGNDELPQNFAEAEKGKETRGIAAKQAGFGNHETLKQAKQVIKEGTDKLVEAMDAGAVSISAAADIATVSNMGGRGRE